MVEIRALRIRTGMSRREFSEKFNIPVRTLEGWESRSEPPVYITGLIRKVLDLEDEVEAWKQAAGSRTRQKDREE